MSERKVLNKYYPPDFDPAKVPKLRLQRERQYTVRTMAPFNMRCNTCGDYIYQGKKFNAKTENVQDETYIGLRIYRFYIRCPKCISEISFKTDPQNEDYTLEHGATRLFEAAKMLRKAAEQEKTDREEEEANNPMKVLENRTKDSKLEMEIIENLEELRELNTRKADIDYAEILRRKAEASEAMMRKQEEEDEEFVRQLFGKQEGGIIKRLDDEGADEEGDSSRPGSSLLSANLKRPSDVLISDEDPLSKKVKPQAPAKSKFSSRSSLAGLVKIKKPSAKAAVLPAALSSSGDPVSCLLSGSHPASRVSPGEARGGDSPAPRMDTVRRMQSPAETTTKPVGSLPAAKAIGGSSEAVGGLSEAIRGSSKAVGGSSEAVGGSSKAIGGSSEAVGGSSEAIRGSSEAVGGSSEAIGGSSKAVGGSSEAVGGSSEAIGGSSEAVGGSSEAVGGSSEAVGDSHRGDDIPEADSGAIVSSSIQEGLSKRLGSGSSRGAKPKAKSVGLSLLGGYAVSDDSNESDDSTE